MKNKQQTLENIHNLLYGKDESKSAIAYGITKDTDGVNLISKLIAENNDIYEMIDELHDDLTYLENDYVTLRTTGWAAPLGDNGEVEGKPSEHPKRRRVCLFVSVDITNKEVMGSSLKFDDDEEIIYDFNTATGSLADALSTLVA